MPNKTLRYLEKDYKEKYNQLKICCADDSGKKYWITVPKKGLDDVRNAIMNDEFSAEQTVQVGWEDGEYNGNKFRKLIGLTPAKSEPVNAPSNDGKDWDKINAEKNKQISLGAIKKAVLEHNFMENDGKFDPASFVTQCLEVWEAYQEVDKQIAMESVEPKEETVDEDEEESRDIPF